MTKKIIIAINNNKALSLVAVLITAAVAIFGCCSGWVGAGLAAAAGIAVLLLEAMRRAYTNSWRHQLGERYLYLCGMSICFAVAFGGGISAIATTSIGSILWIMAIVAAGLVVAATAFTLLKKAWNDYRPIFKNWSWVVWLLFIGTIVLMATSWFALVHIATGTELTSLWASRGVRYGCYLGGGLIAPFVLAFICILIADGWHKLVRWAER